MVQLRVSLSYRVKTLLWSSVVMFYDVSYLMYSSSRIVIYCMSFYQFYNPSDHMFWHFLNLSLIITRGVLLLTCNCHLSRDSWSPCKLNQSVFLLYHLVFINSFLGGPSSKALFGFCGSIKIIIWARVFTILNFVLHIYSTRHPH